MKLKASLLNKKNNILLIVVIFLIIIVISLFGLSKKHNSKTNEKKIVYTDDDSSVSISISISNKFQFSKVESDSYELALYSSVLDSGIYFSEVEVKNIRDIFKFIEADKNDYISKFSNISQVSDITETLVCENKAYNYHFYYKNNMYVDVYWVLKENSFIIIDFNINTDNTDLSIIKDFLNNLSLN